MHESILQSVGRTPLVKLRRLSEGLQATVAVKVESPNPGGSVKDRVGLAMIAEAERAGPAAARRHDHRGDRRQHRRRPGHGRRRQGLPLHLRPARQDERREDPPAQGLRRRGRHHADRRRRPTRRRATTASPTGWPARSPAPGGPTSSPTSPTPRSTTAPPAPRSGSRPRAGSPPSSPASAPAAPSPASPATSRNATRRSRSSAPTRKARSCRAARRRPWKVEGIGEDFVPKTFNSQLVDDWVRVGDAESFHTARDLARREGILVGGSSGTTVAAALRYARRLEPERPRRRPRGATPAATT